MRFLICFLVFTLSCTLIHCGKDSVTGPDAAKDEDRDSVREFIIDSLLSLSGLDTAVNRDYFLQGSLKETANLFDLALEGPGLFALRLDTQNYYLRRPGRFFQDKEGYLIREFNGPRLMGWAFDSAGTRDDSLQSIRIIKSQLRSMPSATTSVKYEGNLNSDSEGLGTVLYTNPFYHRVDEFNTRSVGIPGDGTDNDYGVVGYSGGHHSAAALTFSDIASDPRVLGSVPLYALHNGSGESLQIKTGDIITVTATIPDATGTTETIPATLEVIDDSAQSGRVGSSATEYRVANIQQLLLATQDFLTGSAWNSGGGSSVSGARLAIMPDGKVRVENGTGSAVPIRNLTFTSNRPISRTFISNAFSFNSTIPSGGYSDTPDMLLRPARADDHIFNPMYFDASGVPLPGVQPVPQLFTETGNEIDLQQGDLININALLGYVPKNARNLAIDQGTGLGTSTTMKDILDNIRNTLNLPEFDGTISNNRSVSINATGTDDDLLPEGAIVIRGQPEAAFAINNFSLMAQNAMVTTEPPADFNTNAVVTQLQQARDSGVYDTSIEIYDAYGLAHTLTMRFTHSGLKDPATWCWEVSTHNGEQILQGRTGRITFGQDGTPSAFLFDDIGKLAVRINPMNGADTIDIRIEWGSPGLYTGITQFAMPTTVGAVSQNGNVAGTLKELNVDSYGTITGEFTNNTYRDLWKIAVTEFPCPEGLRPAGYNYVSKTAKSGEPERHDLTVWHLTVIHPYNYELAGSAP